MADRKIFRSNAPGTGQGKARTRRLLWLLVFLLSLAGITVYGGVISYSFFYYWSMLPLLSGVYLLYVRVRFKIYQQIDTRTIVSGQPVSYRFILENDDITVYSGISVRLYSGFSQVERLNDAQRYRLLPGMRVDQETKLTCRYRGEYEVGVRKIIIYDFLGLFSLPYALPSPLKVQVVPDIVKIQEFKRIPALHTMLETEYSAVRNEPDLTVREYLPGDPLKRIHWKASARGQGLKVRNMIGNRKLQIAILFDTERISDKMEIYLPSEHKTMELVIALLYYFAFQQAGTMLLWEAESSWPESVKGTPGLMKRELVRLKQFEEIYQEAAALVFMKNRSFPAMLKTAYFSRMLSDSSLMFLVVQTMTPELFSLAVQLASEERLVILYVITEQDIKAYVRQSSPRLYIMAVHAEQDLGEVL